MGCEVNLRYKTKFSDGYTAFIIKIKNKKIEERLIATIDSKLRKYSYSSIKIKFIFYFTSLIF